MAVVATEPEVKKIINSEREAKIRSAFFNAWSDWMTNPTRNDHSRWARTRACMVFERLAARLLEEFKDDKSAMFIWKNETVMLFLDNQLVIRFKKANEQGLGNNIETQAALDYCDPQADIPGLLPTIQKVEIVYDLNDLETAIHAIMVSARDGDTKLWSYNIDVTGEGEGTLPIPMPQRPAPTTTAEDLVIPRKFPVRHEQSDEQDE